ncbi:MAG: nitroreductase/quinone reductase family protein [Terriglobales bacterium]|nr:nitroreductase/quinone reductase family protein [Terriglobales bacterium]
MARGYNLYLMANSSQPIFRKPTPVERIFNRALGFLIGIGIGFRGKYLLEVRGRTSGRTFSTPVNLLQLRGKQYLVAPRGRTQWVRNAEVAGEITLKKGRSRSKFRLQVVSDRDKPEILKAYLDQFKNEVQTFFPVPAGSPAQAFSEIAQNYPAFELTVHA